VPLLKVELEFLEINGPPRREYGAIRDLETDALLAGHFYPRWPEHKAFSDFVVHARIDLPAALDALEAAERDRDCWCAEAERLRGLLIRCCRPPHECGEDCRPLEDILITDEAYPIAASDVSALTKDGS
jgi:hypothetical protein